MPAKFGQSSDEQESSNIRKAPSHLEVDSIPKLTGHDVKELRKVEGPLENIPEDAKINNFVTNELPGLFVPCHCNELDAKIQIMMVLKISYNYLKQPNLKLGNHSNFKQPLLIWCSALEHHQLCANSFPPSDLILIFFPLVEMLLSPRGTKPLEGFLFASELNE